MIGIYVYIHVSECDGWFLVSQLVALKKIADKD